MTLPQILAIEGHVEAVMVPILQACISPNGDGTWNVFASRSSRIAETPRIEVKHIAGAPAKDHEKNFINLNQRIYDTYIGELQVIVTTNRTTDQTPNNHVAILGAVRAKMQLVNLRELWPEASIWWIVDSREQGTLDSEDSEQNIDISTLSWFFIVQMNPHIVPDNPNP